MKKRSLKKLVTGMAIGLLFSTTAVFGATSYTYSYEMHPGQIEYTNAVVKTTTTGYSTVAQAILQGTIRYVVVDSLYGTKSEQVRITGANTVNIDYHDEVVRGETLKLKVQNNTADNQGRTVNLSFRWTP